jgi:hypothetical protein
MANPEHLAKLKEGVEAWNEWRAKNLDIVPDLSKADLQGAYLMGANLWGVKLFSETNHLNIVSQLFIINNYNSFSDLY